MTPALLIIDMQKEFYSFNPKAFEEKLIPNISRFMSFARSQGIPIVHIITRYSKDMSDWPKAMRELKRIWCLEESESAEIVDGITALIDEKIIIKKRFSGFYETDLEIYLQNNNVDSLFITGYSSDVCVRMTTMDAYYRDYDIYLLSDCVEADMEETEQSIKYLQFLTKLKVVESTELMHCRSLANKQTITREVFE